MKMVEALAVMRGADRGYMVHFQFLHEGQAMPGHFPEVENGEPLIYPKQQAWDFAKKFAAKTRNKCVDIHVVNHNFHRVDGGVLINNRSLREVKVEGRLRSDRKE